ncbi:hypothetical protein Elgi_24040 [Paenibacillus elgii]|nr:hypothetical protein Elgi_24040 [Paenibacillus elgii]
MSFIRRRDEHGNSLPCWQTSMQYFVAVRLGVKAGLLDVQKIASQPLIQLVGDNFIEVLISGPPAKYLNPL